MKLNVRHLGMPGQPLVGALADDARGRVFFQYDADFAQFRGADAHAGARVYRVWGCSWVVPGVDGAGGRGGAGVFAGGFQYRCGQ